MQKLVVRVDLSVAALQALGKPVVGQGGFQSLLRQLQAQISDAALILTPALITKIVRYVKKYGQGGFQGRLDTVLAELESLARALQPLVATK
jgi:hypothetical protein